MSQTEHLPELESLRAQVAELSRKLAARDQSMQDLREQSDLLKAIVEGTAADTGDEFFASLATHLTASLHMQYAVIGEIADGTPVTIRTVAVASGGALLDNFEYDLTQAPCGTALTESFWCYEQGVQGLFPHFPPLATLGVDSHSGVSIRNKQGDVVGLIVVMDTKPITNQERLQALLHVFAPRVAAELQRKHTETALQEQTQRLAHAQAFAHLGNWVWEIGSGRMEWSDEQFRIFGHEPGAVTTTHETFLAAVLPDDHDRVLVAINAALVDYAPFDLECRIVRPDGEVRVIHARGEVHRDATGHPIGLDGTVLDITERKQVEDALRTSEERWQLALRGSNDGIWDWNIQTGNVFFSTRWKEMRGYEEHELAHALDEWRSRIHPDDLDRVLQSLDTYLAKQSTEFRQEYRVQRKDGSYLWVLDRGVALWADDGTPLRMAGSESDITERKRGEEALRESEARSRSIVETALDAVIAIDQGGRVIGWNPQAESMFGYSAREAIGRGLSETIIPIQFRQAHAAGVQRVFQNGENPRVRRRLEFSALHRDGHEFPVEFAMALTHAGGQPVLNAFVRDITERKRAETKIQEQSKLLDLIFEHSLDCIVLLDKEYNFIRVSETYAKACQRDVSEFPGRNHFEYYPSPLKEEFEDAIQRDVSYNKTSCPFTFPDHPEWGVTYWDLGMVPIRGASGDIELLLFTLKDVTEREWAEEALRASEERFRAAYHNASVGMSICDLSGRLQEVNQAVCEILGYSKQELLAKDFQSLTHPDDLSGNLDRIGQLLSGAAVHQVFEKRYVRKDGGTVWAQVGLSVIRNHDDAPSHLLAMVQDITERKQAESKLRLAQFTIDHAVDAVYWINREAKILDVNEAASLMLGYSKDELCAMTVHDLNPDFQADRWPGFWAETQQYKTMAFENFHRSKTGQLIPVEVSINHLIYEGQELHCAFVRNIAERKKAQEELRRSKARLTYILENNPAVVYARQVGDGWPMTFITPNVYELLGYTSVDILCDPDRMDNLIHPDDECDLMTRGMPQLLSDGAHTFVYRLRHRDGTYRWIENRARLTDNGEGTLQIIGTITDVTERKKTEEALREREEALARFKATLDQTDDCVFMFAPDTLRFIYCNRGAVEQVGYTEAELFTMTPLDIKPEFTERSFRELLQPLRDGRRASRVFEAVHRHKDGHDVAVEVSLQLVREQGQEGRFVAVVRDITERKRAEEALRVSEERFNLAVRGSNTGIWDWDLRTNKTYFSPQWKSMLGYEEHELRGEFSEWEERLHPDDRERALATVQAYLKGDIPQYELQHRLRHKDGSYRWILARGVSISDAEGKPYRMAGSHIDITEQKQTQEALAQRERQLRTVLDALPVGVWFTDATGKIRLTNPAGRRIWDGVQQVGLEGTEGHPGWWENVSFSGEPHRWALARVLTKGEATLNEELIFQCLDGTSKVIINSAVPLFGENGQVSGAIIVNQDITERKALERDRAQTQAFLQSILENIPHIITVKDAKTLKIVQMNRAAELVLGLDRRALADKTLYDCLPEGEANALWAADMDALQRQTLVEVPEHVVKRKGERDRIFRTKKAPILDAEGEPQYILTISEDITERKCAEDALRQSHAFIRQIIDTDPNFIFTKDREGRFTLVNQAVADAYGSTVEDLVGKTDADFNRKADEGTFFRGVDLDVMNTREERFIPEEIVSDAHGKRRWVQTVKRPILDETGRAIMVLGAATDITDRKRMEEALRQRERDLRAAIEERERISQDLHDGILQSLFAIGLTLETSKSMLSPRKRKTSGPPLDQAIDQLNRVMHEIRNFIAGLGSDLLQGKDLPTALRHMLDSLTQNHATRVRLAVEDRAAQAVSAEQSLHLLHVIQEAVSNCIRHGRAQEATVSLKMLKQGVRLSIRDNGGGFNPDAAKGTGHGLINMAARAQKIGGRFTVLSKVNEGTRIVLDLPKESSYVRC